MIPDRDRFNKAFTESVGESIHAQRVDIVVMGPNDHDPTLASLLRKHITTSASLHGASILPEHKDTEAIAQGHYGGGHTLSHYEVELVKASDLLVLIPDSPGSFCELGLFSMMDTTAPKTVILIDSQYEDNTDYISEGPVKAARHHRAMVFYVDYRDVDAAWMLVQQALERVRAAKAFKKHLTG